MKSKIHLFALCLLLTLSFNLLAQQSVHVNAIKANNYGVVYSLPKTSVVVRLKIKKTVYERGEFYQYAQRYLGLDPITETKTEYSLEDAMLINRGIADKENARMVLFKSNTVAPFLSLTPEGLIVAINTDGEIEKEPTYVIPSIQKSSLDAKRLLSEEVLAAGSIAKQAELIAKQILELRRSKNDILIGEADNMPPDGEAYKVVMSRIDEQEKALTGLFSGNTFTEYEIKDIVMTPGYDNIDKKVIARFSSRLGLLEPDNLAGAPLYISLTKIDGGIMMDLSAKEREKLDKKLNTGVVYNIPGKAEIDLELGEKLLKKQEMDIVQYGTQDVLTKQMIDNKKQPIQVVFYPNLGAIKQINQ